MVTVGELVVINHHAGDARRFRVAPPILIGGRRIHIGEKCLHSFLDWIGTAERPYHAFLFHRVSLLFPLPCHSFFFTRSGRQRRAVLPIGVRCQKHIGIEPVVLIPAADVFPVGGTSRPVHQLIHFERAEIDRVHTNLVRKIPGDGIVFIRGDVPRQRHEDSRSWGFRRMTVCRVDDGETRKVKIVKAARLQSVIIQSNHGAADDLGRFPTRPFQRSRQESALVLHGILLAFFHSAVLYTRFSGSDGDLQFFPKLFHRHFSCMPDKCRAAVSKAKC